MHLILALLLLFLSVMPMPGGFGEGRIPESDEIDILQSVKAAVEGSTGKTYTTFEAVSFTTQVVAGTNYLFKVKVDGEEYIHVKVHKPLPHTGKAPELMTATASTADAPLAP